MNEARQIVLSGMSRLSYVSIVEMKRADLEKGCLQPLLNIRSKHRKWRELGLATRCSPNSIWPKEKLI